MNAELDTYDRYIREKIEQLVEAAGALDDDLNRAPDFDGANSAFVIATHTFGNMRSFVTGVAGGVKQRRDRPGEFASSGTIGDLRAAANALKADVTAALGGIDPASLDEVIMPTKELWGEGEPHEMSRRDAIVHALEHAGIHYGQMLVTVDLLRSGR
jgi:uncharacterized damage-inducible protein DinB